MARATDYLTIYGILDDETIMVAIVLHQLVEMLTHTLPPCFMLHIYNIIE